MWKNSATFSPFLKAQQGINYHTCPHGNSQLPFEWNPVLTQKHREIMWLAWVVHWDSSRTEVLSADSQSVWPRARIMHAFLVLFHGRLDNKRCKESCVPSPLFSAPLSNLFSPLLFCLTHLVSVILIIFF